MAVDTEQATAMLAADGQPAAPSAVEPDESDAVSFPELVFAHFLRQNELYRAAKGGDPAGVALAGPAEREYKRRRAVFTGQHGRILDSHWCTYEISAVALTDKEVRHWRHFWRRESILRLHMAVEWATRDTPQIGHQLHRCQSLAIRIGEVLRGTSQRIAMERTLGAAAALLASVDRQDGPPPPAEIRRIVARSERDLAEIRAYYEQAGEKAARLVYFLGMLQGIVWVGVAMGVLALLLWAFGSFDRQGIVTQSLLASCAMGALGALVSVMSRMASREKTFALDYEVGRKTLRKLGMFRPFIGAAFAFAVFVALRSDLVQIGTVEKTVAFYATVAFVAGFSERWAKVILDGALAGAGSESEQAAPAALEPDEQRKKESEEAPAAVPDPT
ncbi:MAG TPA: hypothetical protein VGF23_09490 [Gaiellaceae bacterium]|jgi:hypothetical protein